MPPARATLPRRDEMLRAILASDRGNGALDTVVSTWVLNEFFWTVTLQLDPLA